MVAPLDLNGLPQAKVYNHEDTLTVLDFSRMDVSRYIFTFQEPIEFEKSKNFCCLWCKSGPLTLTVKLPTSGYVPGQTIPFQIEIENGSNIRVRPINCELRKVISYLKLPELIF